MSEEEAEQKVASGDFTADEIAELSRVLGTVVFIRRDRDRRMKSARSSLEILRATRDAGTAEPVFVDPNYPPPRKDKDEVTK